MEVKLPNKNKRNVIILSVLAFVFLASGIFLLWRVNQEKELSPGESDAGEACVPEYPPYNNLPYTTAAAPQKSELIIYYRALPSYTALAQFVITDPDGQNHTITASSTQAKIRTGIILEAGEKVTVKAVYETAGGKAATGWQQVNPGNTCGSGAMGPPQGGTCKRYEKVDVSSYISWAESGFENQTLISRQCWADAKEWEGDYDFDDFFVQFYYLSVVPANTCDAKGAKWITKPAASVEYGKTIPFEYVTGDTDGVQSANIIVKLDGEKVSFTKVPATGDVPNITVKGTLNSNGALVSGSHKLEILWNDVKGAGGTPCYAYATFTVGQAPVNTCDAKGAKWVTKPAASVEYGKTIPFEYVTGDTDGVQSANIIVKLDGEKVSFTKVPATGDVPNITVKGTLNSNGALVSGSHKLEISWNDVKGAGGTPCYAYSVITILPENPEWDIEKQAVETCINDGTANPISNLSYTVTITNTNTGSGSGKIDVIEDTLDPKVDSTKVTDISNGGVIENGKITWNLTSPLSDFKPGESKSFTYSVSVEKEFFGIYENTVTATPGAAEGYSPTNLEASANIEARCNTLTEPEEPPEELPEKPPEEPLPDTGIFDDSQSAILTGFGLLILGFTWRVLGQGIYISVGFLNEVPKKIFIQMKDVKEDIRAKRRIREMKVADKRKKNFERKVVKD